MRRRLALLAAPALLLAPRPARAGAWPRLLTDGLGREVPIPREPRRIVAIFASNTEMLAAIGAVERVVGIESFTRFPPEVRGLPLVGGRLGFSAEAIARLAPDLVVMTPARNAAHALTEPMARVGVPTLVVTHRDVPQVFRNIRLLGAATGLEGRAEALVEGLEARLAAVEQHVAGRAPVPVFLETSSTGRGVFGTVRPGTYSFDAVRLAGGASVFPDLAAHGPAQVSGEAILRADPAWYLVAGRPEQAAEVPHRTGFDGLRAVREGRVQTVQRAQFLIPGPRVVDGIEALARLLHPPPLVAGRPR
jgi:iron complex transport system substrate-binding protein